jgi:DHA3 family macrolide efflux protein-like MFS transporter
MKNWKQTFYIIWTGQIFSTLSSSIVGFAIVYWLGVETRSASVLAYAMIAALLPQAVLGLFTGVFVDRWDRKKTMIFADSFIALCTGVLCVMFYLGKAEIWQVYILLALRSVGGAFHSPAMQASIPLLAPESQLMRIAGVNQMIASVSNIAGPAIAAVLITVMDMTYILMLDIGGAIIACTALLFVTIPNPEKKIVEQGKNIFREMKEGIVAIFEKRGLAWLFSFDVLASFFILPVAALFPLMTLNYFGGTPFQMGLVEVAWGIGMLIGGGILGLRKMKMANKVLIMNITDIIMGAAFVFSGILPPSGLIIFFVATFIGGIAGAIFWGAFTVILQTKINPAVLGRVFSIYGSLTLLPAIPGLVATGYVADTIGLTFIFIVSGIVLIGTGISLLCIPSVRKLGKSTIGQQLPE